MHVDYVWTIRRVIYEREKGEAAGGSKENERERLHAAMHWKIKRIMSCYSHSIGRWITGRGLAAVKKYENRYFWSAILLPICWAYECSRTDWTRFTPMIPDQLSIPRTQRRPGYEYHPFFSSCNSISPDTERARFWRQ